MTTNNCKSYFAYLNKLVYKYNNTNHRSSEKRPIDPSYSDLTEEIETNPKAHKLNVYDKMRLSIKFTLNIYQEKYLLSILCLKLILRRKKLKI